MHAAPWLDGLLTALGATAGAVALQHADAFAWLLLALREVAARAEGMDPRWLWLAWGAGLAALARAADGARRG